MPRRPFCLARAAARSHAPNWPGGLRDPRGSAPARASGSSFVAPCDVLISIVLIYNGGGPKATRCDSSAHVTGGRPRIGVASYHPRARQVFENLTAAG